MDVALTRETRYAVGSRYLMPLFAVCPLLIIPNKREATAREQWAEVHCSRTVASLLFTTRAFDISCLQDTGAVAGWQDRRIGAGTATHAAIDETETIHVRGFVHVAAINQYRAAH